MLLTADQVKALENHGITSIDGWCRATYSRLRNLKLAPANICGVDDALGVATDKKNTRMCRRGGAV